MMSLLSIASVDIDSPLSVWEATEALVSDHHPAPALLPPAMLIFGGR